MRIALVGTRGVPARYGGFETAVEEVGQRLAASGHEVTVYCRNSRQRLTEYKGMHLINLPALRRKSLETLSHTVLSVLHVLCRRRTDVVFLFNAANAPVIPLLRLGRVPVAVHVDGLEWQRAKWAGLGRTYYRWAERRSARWANAVIADASGIADHVRAEHGVESVLLTYGAPLLPPVSDRIAELGLTYRGFHLVVARLEPENHVQVILEGFLSSTAKLPLVVVGTSPYPSPAVESLIAQMRASDRVHHLGALWDQELLNHLYVGALTYLHGHSVGGTNPSLLRAMGAGSPVLAFDVIFNREVCAGRGSFFSTPTDVADLVVMAENDVEGMAARGRQGRDHVAAAYRWDDVAAGYADLAEILYA